MSRLDDLQREIDRVLIASLPQALKDGIDAALHAGGTAIEVLDLVRIRAKRATHGLGGDLTVSAVQAYLISKGLLT